MEILFLFLILKGMPSVFFKFAMRLGIGLSYTVFIMLSYDSQLKMSYTVFIMLSYDSSQLKMEKET
jgi:hypothetical protein